MSQTSLRSDRRITLTDPVPEESQTYYASTNVTFVVDFDVESADFSRKGSDLLIQGVNGGLIMLNGFFSDAGTNMPTFELQSGSSVSGTDFLQMYSSDLLSPAPLEARSIPHLYGQANEANLAKGTAKDPDALEQKVLLPEGYTVDTSKGDWVANGDVYELRHENNPGYLTYDPNTGILTHTLTDAVDSHAEQGPDSAFVTYPAVALKDGKGEDKVLDVKIEVIDDVPEVTFGGTNNAKHITYDPPYNTPYEGTWSVEFGADGASQTASPLQISVTRPGVGTFTQSIEVGVPVNITIKGVSYGTLTLRDNGTYSYDPGAALDAYLQFTLSATDSDGDVSNSDYFALGLLVGDGPKFSYLTPSAPVNESELANGSPIVTDIPFPDPKRVDIHTDKSGWEDLNGDGTLFILKGQYGHLEYTPAEKKLQYILTEPVSHAPGSDLVTESFNDIHMRAYYEGDIPRDIIILIQDDAPTVSVTGPAEVKSGATIEGDLAASFGVDGPAASGAYAVIIKNQYGQSERVELTPGTATELSVDGFTYGSITIDGNGKYSFTAAPNLNEKVSLVFEVTDGDGDTASNQGNPLDISINKPVPPVVPPIGSGESVDEANLANGTDPNAVALVKELDVPDGYTIHTFGWDEDPSNSNIFTLPGDYGVLRYDSQTNTLTYELTSNVVNAIGDDLAKDLFPVIQITDADGNIYDITAEIAINDDRPDVAIGADSNEAKTGNDFSGNWDINYGADGKGGMALTVTDAKGDSFDFPITFGQSTEIVIGNTNYGKVTFNDDGSYVFRPAPNTESKLSFVLSATDGDGDTVTSSPFEITSKVPDGPVIDPEADLSNWFAEAALPDGTAPSELDLEKALKIPDGYTVDTTGWESFDNDTYYTLETNHGTLKYTPGNNELTYTLGSNAQHSDPDNAGANDIVNDNKSIVLKDAGENTFSVNTTIKVHDDAPVADMTADKTEGSTGYVFNGEWDITYGADGTGSMSLKISDGTSATPQLISDIVFGQVNEISIGGKVYGSIIFNADGSYAFTPAADTPSTLSFTLGATDGDGDFREAGNPFTVTSDTPPPPIIDPTTDLTNWFAEAYLTNGTKDPKDPALSNEHLTKELHIPDGYTLNTKGWIPNTDDDGTPDGTFTLKGKYGHMTYDGDDNTLTYTLEKTAMHKDPVASGADDVLQDKMNVVLQDAGGNTWEIGTKIEVRDDAPETSFGAAENKASSGYEFVGEWDVKYGADGKGAMAISVDDKSKNEPFLVTLGKPIYLNIDGTDYGKLTFNKDGTYTFVPPANYEGALRFVLMAMDKDGDVRQGSHPFEIVVEKPTIDFPPETFDKQTFSESNLSNGSAPDDNALTKFFDIPDKYTVDTKGWTYADGKYTLPGQYGVLTYNADDNTLSYTLQDAARHGQPGTSTDSLLYDYMKVVIKDSGGNSWTIDANIKVQDDAPVPNMTAPTAEAEGGAEFNGTWTVNYGADGDGNKMVLKVLVGSEEQEFNVTFGSKIDLVVNGQEYGSITINQDGTYTYVPAPNKDFSLSFALGATDGDGDLRFDQSPFEIEVTPPVGPPDDPTNLAGEFFESALSNGTHTEAGETVTKDLKIPDGFFVDYTGWALDPDVVGGYSKPTAYGKLTYVPSENKLSYTLESNAQHSNPDASGRDDMVTDNLNIVLKNAGNNTWSISTNIKVYDDAPTMDMTATKTEAEGGYDFGGNWSINYGADGDGKAMFLKVMVNGEEQEFPVTFGSAIDLVVGSHTYGQIVINANGTYTFKPVPNETFTIAFGLGAKDGDGDITFDQSPLSVSVEPPSPPVIKPGDLFGEFFESALSDGTHADAGEEVTKDLKIPDGFSIDYTGWAPDPDVVGGYSKQTAYGKLTYVPNENKLSYTLESNATHSDSAHSGRDDSILDQLSNIVLKDAGNNTWTVTPEINVFDDAPVLGFGGDDPDAESGYEYVGEWNVDFGADGQGSMAIIVGNGTTSESIAITVGVACDIIIGGTKYGTITFKADNSYSFVPVPNLEAELTFKLEAIDGDGDIRYSADDAGFKINIIPPEDLSDLNGPAFDEAYLPNGTSPNDGSLVKEIPLHGNGVTVDTSAAGWSEDSGIFSKNVDGGQLIYDAGQNKLYFKLGEAFTHTQQGKDSISHTIKDVALLDSGKNSHLVDITVEIVDDMPVATLTSQSATEVDNQNGVVTGTMQLQSGADAGQYETATEIKLTLDSTYESLTLNDIDITLPKDGSVVNVDTLSGVLSLKYLANGQVHYSFTAKNGMKDSTESLSLTARDKEGDYATAELKIKYDETIIPGGSLGMETDEAAIPDLGSSHYLLDTFEDTETLDPALVLDNTTSVVWEGPADPSEYRADVNGDGTYEQVSWKQEGNTMQGYVGDELVVEVEAVFDSNNTFTGEVKTTLHKPIQHGTGLSPDNDVKSIDLTLTQQQAGGREVDIKVKVDIVDDSPARDYGYSNTTHIIDIVKDPIQPQSVFLMLDVSGSIKEAQGLQAVEAIKALAQAYIDNGIDTVMTISTFAMDATTYYVHATPQEIIDNLTWASIVKGQLTNYEVALEAVMDLMEDSRAQPEYSSWGQTLYFISDGEITLGDELTEKWRDYRFERGEELDVYSLSVTNKVPVQEAVDSMMNVSANEDNYYHVSDYKGLLEQLVHIVHDQSYGNMLTNAASADVTTLYAVEYDGEQYAVKPSGKTEIDLGDGVKLTVWPDGNYEVESGQIEGNVIKEIILHTVDADGDRREFSANLVLRDNGSQAYDDVVITHSFDNGVWLSNFHGNNPVATNGSFKYTNIADGALIPMIDGYSDGHMGGKLVLGKNGGDKLTQLCGGEEGLEKLFSEMLEITPSDLGDNAIMSMNFQQNGGHIAFNWTFRPGTTQSDKDTAFWILKDASGKIIQAGLLSQGKNGNTWDSGITHIELPDIYQQYSLHIVQQEMGTGGGEQSILYLKDVVYIPDGQLRAKGNVLTDVSPDGLTDGYTQQDVVYAIIYAGQEYLIGDSTSITTAQGVLTIDNIGNYTFLANSNVQADLVQDFTYVIKNSQGGSTSAELYIRSEDRVYEGNESDNLMDVSAQTEDGDIIKGGGGNDTIIGGSADEIIYGGSGNDSIVAGAGDDLIYGGEGDDVIYGGSGNDTIYGGDGNDKLYGGDGDDVIYGGSGNDRIDGGAGNDLIYSGSGTNVITGGTGADTFGWLKNTLGGRDLITDFKYTEGDRLDFSELLDQGETLADYFENDVSHLLLGESKRVLSFLLSEDTTQGTLEKQVEIVFQDSDTHFDSMVTQYNAASGNEATQLEILYNFLNSLTM